MCVSIMRCSKQIHNNFLYFRYKCDPSFNDIKFYKCNKKDNPHNYVKSRVFCYGKKGKGGLVIVEGTRKSRENKNHSALTVAHYYAISRGNAFTQNNNGLSMVVHFYVSGRKFEIYCQGSR